MTLSLMILSALSQAQFDMPQPDGGAMVFQIQTETDAIHIVESTTDLLGAWKEERLIEGTGEVVGFTNQIGDTAQFIRARSFPRVIESKPGVSFSMSLGLTNSVVQWTAEGELPAGINFTNGVFLGIPADASAEKYADGNYTNILRLAGNPETTAKVVHHVRLSYARNLYPSRPGGPSFRSICLECHGSGFPPDFAAQAPPLLNGKSGVAGTCPEGLPFIVPGDLTRSLIYQKLTAPPCGDRMPQGGPFFSAGQIERVARWIKELKAGDTD